MKYIEIKLTSDTYETSEVDLDDEWSRASTSTDWTIDDEFTVHDTDAYNRIPIEFNIKHVTPYYAVYFIYSTGDSFGNDERSHCEIHGLYQTKKEAQSEVDRLKSITGYSVPWNGYFESLDELEIKTVYLK